MFCFAFFFLKKILINNYLFSYDFPRSSAYYKSVLNEKDLCCDADPLVGQTPANFKYNMEDSSNHSGTVSFLNNSALSAWYLGKFVLFFFF